MVEVQWVQWRLRTRNTLYRGGEDVGTVGCEGDGVRGGGCWTNRPTGGRGREEGVSGGL